MDKRAVLVGGTVSALLALLSVLLAGIAAAGFWGTAAGVIVAVRARDTTDGLFDGALAGLIGGVGTVGVVLLLMTLEAFVLTGSWSASTSIGAYFSVATMFILIPLFVFEGMVTGAIGTYLREKMSQRKSTIATK
ncbi:DUF5518 domain-containing protein [Halogeometricum luteum]|uniref:DUF5518 domain-containing protein n=1 Tax=Halogeometricum luteum TaxID=2950537 RepID=A0ABU2FYR2_9EURY|nr:DUF5518 domain-containing protein [Halogeometricum sp. S3BR5-2]MDS0293666.1 DUF5518 domain-containing protein [Halogeometricum sp. S3BR5-2]